MDEEKEKKAEFYKAKMNEACAQMASLCENPVENSWRGMQEAKAYVLKYGNCNDVSKADMISEMWSHFNCELMTLTEYKGNKENK